MSKLPDPEDNNYPRFFNAQNWNIHLQSLFAHPKTRHSSGSKVVGALYSPYFIRRSDDSPIKSGDEGEFDIYYFYRDQDNVLWAHIVGLLKNRSKIEPSTIQDSIATTTYLETFTNFLPEFVMRNAPFLYEKNDPFRNNSIPPRNNTEQIAEDN